MKKLHLLAAALVAVLAAPSAFADPVSGNVSATIPNQCAITGVDDVSATFGLGNVNAVATGQVHILCNQGTQYQVISSTPDAAGRFAIANGSATMEVEMRSTDTGLTWYDNYNVSGTGTGVQQEVGFELNFNPDAEYLPEAGTFTGSTSFDLLLV